MDAILVSFEVALSGFYCIFTYLLTYLRMSTMSSYEDRNGAKNPRIKMSKIRKRLKKITIFLFCD